MSERQVHNRVDTELNTRFLCVRHPRHVFDRAEQIQRERRALTRPSTKRVSELKAGVPDTNTGVARVSARAQGAGGWGLPHFPNARQASKQATKPEIVAQVLHLCLGVCDTPLHRGGRWLVDQGCTPLRACPLHSSGA